MSFHGGDTSLIGVGLKQNKMENLSIFCSEGERNEQLAREGLRVWDKGKIYLLVD